MGPFDMGFQLRYRQCHESTKLACILSIRIADVILEDNVFEEGFLTDITFENFLSLDVFFSYVLMQYDH